MRRRVDYTSAKRVVTLYPLKPGWLFKVLRLVHVAIVKDALDLSLHAYLKDPVWWVELLTVGQVVVERTRGAQDFDRLSGMLSSVASVLDPHSQADVCGQCTCRRRVRKQKLVQRVRDSRPRHAQLLVQLTNEQELMARRLLDSPGTVQESIQIKMPALQA
jgi:hypothetical protein